MKISFVGLNCCEEIAAVFLCVTFRLSRLPYLFEQAVNLRTGSSLLTRSPLLSEHAHNSRVISVCIHNI